AEARRAARPVDRRRTPQARTCPAYAAPALLSRYVGLPLRPQRISSALHVDQRAGRSEACGEGAALGLPDASRRAAPQRRDAGSVWRTRERRAIRNFAPVSAWGWPARQARRHAGDDG